MDKTILKRILSSDAYLLMDLMPVRAKAPDISMHFVAWTGNLKSRSEIRSTNFLNLDNSFRTALDLAIWNMHTEAVAWLLCCLKGRVMIEYEGKPCTPLNLATENRDRASVSALLEADHKITIEHRWTAILKSTELEDQNTTARLLGIGLSTQVKRIDSECFSFAINAKRLDVIKMLLDCGADASLPIAQLNWPPIIQAIHSRFPAATDLFIKAGGATITERLGWTPMHHAAITNDTETIHKLVLAGAEISRTNDVGQTPLDLAIMRGRGNVVSFLIEHGAERTCGSPPLIFRLSRLDEEIIERFYKAAEEDQNLSE